jgi:hypothetical protein
MPSRAPLRVVDNPRHSEPARFRDALYRAARVLARQPFTVDEPPLVHAARILIDQRLHDTTRAERRELANAEFRLAMTLLREARRQGADRDARLNRHRAAWRAWRAEEPQ